MTSQTTKVSSFDKGNFFVLIPPPINYRFAPIIYRLTLCFTFTKNSKKMSRELGYKIQRVRELKGLKQDVVAEGLGIKQNTYSDIESGKIELLPSDERFKKLAELLGTTPAFIENFDDRYLVNIVNHHNGNGNAAGSINPTIHTIDDLQKMVELIAMPFKAQIESQKEEIQFLRSLLKKEDKA